MPNVGALFPYCGIENIPPKMSGSQVLLQSLLNCKKRETKFQLYLDACNEQQIFSFESENRIRDVVAAINTRLNEDSQRSVGICLLKEFLSQCSDEVFVENSVSWMAKCLKAVSSPNCREAFEVLRIQLEMSHHFQELTKPITTNIVPKLLEQILKNRHSLIVLQSLRAVLQHYPGPCKSKLKTVEEYLLSFLDEEDPKLVEEASYCMCYLPTLKVTGNNDGSTWTKDHMELCATANTLLFELFQNVQEVAIPSVLTELSVGYSLDPLNEENPAEAHYRLAKRFVNILSFIEGMLNGDLKSVKPLRADVLVALAYRVLAVNCKIVNRGQTLEHVALASVLPKIHVATFKLLHTSISCCHGALIKYGSLFCRLVLQILKCTSETSNYGMERPYRHLREAACKFLESWILTALSASSVDLMAKDLITLLLQDVFQKKPLVTLKFQEKSNDATIKKITEKRQRLGSPQCNAGPCEAALQVLCALVQTSGSLLTPSLHLKLQEVVVSLLMEIRRASELVEVPAPYSVAACRMQLYRLLLLLTLHPHSQWPPPVQFALSLFSWGQQDSSLEVAGFCNMAISCVRQMVHPSRTSHQFPVSLQEMRASVGLSDLPPVRGINEKDVDNIPTIKKGIEVHKKKDQPFFENVKNRNEILADMSGENLIISVQSKKNRKRKLSSQNSEMTEIGIEHRTMAPKSSKPCNSNTQVFSVKNLENGGRFTNSDKHCKKMRHLQFVVEELDSEDKINVSQNRQEWTVSHMSKQEKAQSKKKKLSKLKESNEVPTKHRKLDTSFSEAKQSVSELNKSSECKSPVSLSKLNVSKVHSDPVLPDEESMPDTQKNTFHSPEKNSRQLSQTPKSSAFQSLSESRYPQSPIKSGVTPSIKSEPSFSSTKDDISSKISVSNSPLKALDVETYKSPVRKSLIPESPDHEPQVLESLVRISPVHKSPVYKAQVFESAVQQSPVHKTPCKSLILESPDREPQVMDEAIHETPVRKSPGPKTLFPESSGNKPQVVESAIQESPVLKSPVAKSAIQESPVLKSPVAKSAIQESPVLKSPVAKSPDHIVQASPASGSSSSSLSVKLRRSMGTEEIIDPPEKDAPGSDITESPELLKEQHAEKLKIYESSTVPEDNLSEVFSKQEKLKVVDCCKEGLERVCEPNDELADATNKRDDEKNTEEKLEMKKMVEEMRYNLRERAMSPAKFDKDVSELNRINKPRRSSLRTPTKSQSTTNLVEKRPSSAKKANERPRRSSFSQSYDVLSVPEITISSDSESDQVQRRISGSNRRITRSFLKHAAELIDIEEVPSSEESASTEIVKENIKEDKKFLIDCIVEEPDESVENGLQMARDKECVEVCDISDDTNSNNGTKNKSENCEEKYPIKSTSSKAEEDSNSCERKDRSEEVNYSEELKKQKSSEVDKDGESADEDILHTFVDIVASSTD